MRIFKKEGFMKPKKTDDKELSDKLLSDGWVEVDSKGSKVSAKKSNSKKEESE